jgi:hypothetical protein
MAFYRPKLCRGRWLAPPFLGKSLILIMKKKAKTANDHLADILDEIGAKDRIEVVPDGWACLSDLIANSEVPERTMHTRLRKAIADGKIERRQFRIRLGHRTQNTWHYRKVK